MITFIEKDGYYDESLFTGSCHMYPTYMIKNGKEHFIFNRREPDDKWVLEKNEARKKQLIETDGKYFKFNGFYDNPFDMLKSIVERKHHFTSPENIYYGDMKESHYFDFHGNRKEVSAAFHYRIYDEEIAVKIQNVVNFINCERWKEAEILLEKCI